MLSHKHRKDQIHVLTADPILSADVCERIKHDPRMQGWKLIAPESVETDAAVLEIERMARDTVLSRIIIIDVRSQTLPRLQKAYNQVVGFSRRDLNTLCYTLLIGDGPMTLFEPGKSLDVFVPHLARCRVDYGPAAFFYDPFLHYTDEEAKEMLTRQGKMSFLHVPRRLAEGLNKERMTVSEIRRYFRAASAPDDQLEPARQRRTAKLAELYKRRLAKAFPELFGKGAPQTSLFLKEGLRFTGEALALHLYPLHFEDWVCDVAQQSTTRKTAALTRAPEPRRPG